MNDLPSIFQTLQPVGSAVWTATLVALSSSKAAYFAGGFGLAIFLRFDWRTLTTGDWVKAILTMIGLFIVVSVISTAIAGGLT